MKKKGRALQGKNALVTGAGRGLGRAIARAFAVEGARVMMMSLDENELRGALREVEGLAPGAAATFSGNAARKLDVDRAVKETIARFGGIDILVNNAGIIGPPRLLEDTGLSSWNATLGVNLTGCFLFIRAVLPGMVSRRSGKIINIVSGLGSMAFPRFCAYSVSKAGCIQLTRSVSAEMEPYGVQVNAIDPGVMDTAMNEAIRGMGPDVLGDGVYSQLMEYRNGNLLKRPEDVAPLAVFLASPASNGITGRTGTLRAYRSLGWKG